MKNSKKGLNLIKKDCILTFVDKKEAGRYTTKKHFELFQKECKKWISFFNLLSWEIVIKHVDFVDIYGDIQPNDTILSWCEPHYGSRYATIYLSIDWCGVDITTEALKKAAFHEVCELLLYRLREMSNMSSISYRAEEVDAETHAVIRTLENTIFEQHNKKT